MPTNQSTVAHRCRDCQREGRWLKGVSQTASLNYFCCDGGHIWTGTKDGGTSVATEPKDSE